MIITVYCDDGHPRWDVVDFADQGTRGGPRWNDSAGKPVIGKWRPLLGSEDARRLVKDPDLWPQNGPTADGVIRHTGLAETHNGLHTIAQMSSRFNLRCHHKFADGVECSATVPVRAEKLEPMFDRLAAAGLATVSLAIVRIVAARPAGGSGPRW